MEITNKQLDELIEIANKNGVEYDLYEGTLVDSCIFYNAESVFVEGESAKYIIVKERFLNEWSSDLVLTLTNSDEEAEEFRNIFETE